MQLRYLESVVLKKATKVKQNNGSYVNTYKVINNYNVRVEEITDEASITIYGATVNKMYRLSSPRQELESYLKTKLTDNSDNISKYYVSYNNGLYKVSVVRKNWVDIEYNEISQSVEYWFRPC